jgi:heme/copper-type cytochrome/quinol oxidase subunit 3
MAETAAAGPVGLSPEQEEAAFYHEAALNAAWTGTRLMIGVVASGLGAFVFAFFYLRSLNSYNLWYPAGFPAPKMWQGAVIMGLIVVSAAIQALGLRQLKGGKKNAWLGAAAGALLLGLVAVALQIWQLTALPFQPGASGFASVFVGASPVFAVLVLGTMIWLEILIMRARAIPEVSFVEQPPTFAEAASVQRLQASLSAFTLFWGFMAVAAFVLWVLFYLVH